MLETERARNESEANLAEHRKLMARAGDEVRAILEKARKEAEATGRRQLIKQAQAEAELAKQRAQRDIASARDQALAEIWEKTADMAVAVAGKVLSKELTDAEHRRLLDVAIKELPAKATANGHGGQAVMTDASRLPASVEPRVFGRDHRTGPPVCRRLDQCG